MGAEEVFTNDQTQHASEHGINQSLWRHVLPCPHLRVKLRAWEFGSQKMVGIRAIQKRSRWPTRLFLWCEAPKFLTGPVGAHSYDSISPTRNLARSRSP